MLQQLTAPKIHRYYLDQRHKKDLFDKRGLDPKWCEVNCRSISTNLATELLGYTSQSDGIWLEGANFQGQYRPDKPWRSHDSNKAPKYRSPKGEYDIMLPIHPEDPRFWDDIEALKLKCYTIDGNPCLINTEGFFKAISLCSHGIPTIALQGVEMGLTPTDADPQGKRYLVPTLEKFARAGFGFIHAFDADALINPNIIEAQRKLVHQLKKFNIPQYNVTGLWSEEQGKGIDDYIQLNGADKFKQEVLAKAVSIDKWEQQFVKEEKQKKWTQSSLAEELAEEYRPKLAWHATRKCWYWYARQLSGVWSQTVDEAIGALVTTEAKNRLGLYITGLAIRQPGSDATRPITGSDGLVETSDELVTTQTLVSDGSDECVEPPVSGDREAQAVPAYRQPSNQNLEGSNCSDSQPTTTHHHPTPSITNGLSIAVGSFVDYGGEKVEIVGWKDNGKQVLVELPSGKQVLVKRSTLKPWV